MDSETENEREKGQSYSSQDRVVKNANESSRFNGENNSLGFALDLFSFFSLLSAAIAELMFTVRETYYYDALLRSRHLKFFARCELPAYTSRYFRTRQSVILPWNMYKLYTPNESKMSIEHVDDNICHEVFVLSFEQSFERDRPKILRYTSIYFFFRLSVITAQLGDRNPWLVAGNDANARRASKIRTGKLFIREDEFSVLRLKY